MYSLKYLVICLFLWQCGNSIGSTTDELHTSSVVPETTKKNDEDIRDLFSSKSNTSKLLNGNNSTVNDAALHSPSGQNRQNYTQSVTSSTGSPVAVFAVEGGGGDKVKFETKVTDIDRPTTPLSSTSEIGIVSTNLGENSSNNEQVTPRTGFETLEPGKKLPKIVARKGVIMQETGNIVPRKGVNELLSGEITDNPDISIEENSDSVENKTNCVCCPNSTVPVNDKISNESTNSCRICCDQANKNMPPTTNVTNTAHPNSSLPIPETNSHIYINSTFNNSLTNANKSTSLNTLTPTSPPVIRNKKPSITSDIPYDTSTNISANQQPISEKNTQSKTDYVVPVVGIILAVPLIIILVIVIYKKGSEFWERRHYRRMDFLIDGMYNE